VTKWFKTGAVYEEAFFENDLKAVNKAQEFIDAWNALNISNAIHLNRPEVWTFKKGCRRVSRAVSNTDTYQQGMTHEYWA
jgi:hypothetical protein